MREAFLISLRMTLVTIVLTGGVYPLLATGLGQALFPEAAAGSLLHDERGQVIGSSLIGQGFESPGYLQSRPSAAGADGYDAAGSSGSNLGPTSQKLHDRVAAYAARLLAENPEAMGPVPADLVTTSGSGLDPDVTPEGALWQVPRIAKARHVDPERVRQVIEANVEGRTLGFLGEPRVNVLLTNLALDRTFGTPVARLGSRP
jgi:K+-transporting ATPase ATPase C chain